MRKVDFIIYPARTDHGSLTDLEPDHPVHRLALPAADLPPLPFTVRTERSAGASDQQ